MGGFVPLDSSNMSLPSNSRNMNSIIFNAVNTALQERVVNTEK